MNSFLKLRHIRRFNTLPCVMPQSVAEHSFEVAFYLVLFSRQVRFDLKKALIMALLHDLPEHKVSDLPWPMIESMGLEERLKVAEQTVVNDDVGVVLLDVFREYQLKQSLEALLVECADVMSCLEFAVSEIELGNKAFVSVDEMTAKRLNSIFNKLYTEYNLTKEKLTGEIR